MMTQQERIAAAIAAFRSPEAVAARAAARAAEEARNSPEARNAILREHRERIVLARRRLGWQGRREQEARINAGLLQEARDAGARW